MKDDIYTIRLPEFRDQFPASDYLSMGDDLCFLDIKYDRSNFPLHYPCRFDGFIVFFCASGKFDIMLDMKEFEVIENSVFVYMPGSIFYLRNIDEEQKENIRVIAMAMTKEYLSSLKVDIPRLLGSSIQLMDQPYFYVKDNAKKVAERFLYLAKDILESDLAYKQESIASLLSSVLYLGGGLLEAQKDVAVRGRSDTRSREITDKFLRLVAEYHCSERNVAFYANKLCLTPKYLSKLIKEATGKGAAEWIDGYVILEAKNMLKYSSLTIKGIVARLNFPDSSSFHKFFKSRTGVTPLKYRKS